MLADELGDTTAKRMVITGKAKCVWFCAITSSWLIPSQKRSWSCGNFARKLENGGFAQVRGLPQIRLAQIDPTLRKCADRNVKCERIVQSAGRAKKTQKGKRSGWNPFCAITHCRDISDVWLWNFRQIRNNVWKINVI
jgi:hypothetical protein